MASRPEPPRVSRELEEGAHFGAYVIDGSLGRGNMARVYRARHQTLGHAVALEVFDPARAPDAAATARFLREAQVAAALRHPHVVRTYDAGVHEGSPFLVMELLEGRDLEAHLRAERVIEELTLIELAVGIVSGLMALHAQGVVHGDLGPRNVFLVQPPQGPATPKLLDAVLSKPHRGLRLTALARQRLMSAPLYMAPEILLGREPTPASDQYSLGVILYECVTGVNPFVTSSLKESVRLILCGQRPPVMEQAVKPSPGLASIIERVCSVAPEERFPDLPSLGRALLRLADQRTRATWEFSFQPSTAPVRPGARRAVTRKLTKMPSPGWRPAVVALAVLGWATAGVVALRAAQLESGSQYVMLGPRPTATDEVQQQSLALRPGGMSPAAAAPCAAPAGSADLLASCGGLAPAPGENLSLLPADVSEPGALELPPASVPEPEPSEPAPPEEPTSHVTPRGTNNAPIFD